METQKLIKDLKNNIIEISHIVDIFLLQDESIITIWYSTKNNNKRYFATIKNHQHNKTEILELYKAKNINRFKTYIPLTTYYSAVSFMNAYYTILTSKYIKK